MSSLNEKNIKAIVIEELIRRGRLHHGALIANEFTLPSMSRRADLAVLGNRFIGVEIKSEFDSLKRLTAQIEAYRRVFDESILVLAELHLEKVKAQLPSLVEIWVIDQNGGISICQKGPRNRTSTLPDLLSLLSIQELRVLLGKKASHLINRAQLHEAALGTSHGEIRKALRATFHKKYSASSTLFWTTGHLDDLSRFRKRREIFQAHQVKQQLFWKDWMSKTEFLLRK